MAKPPSKSAKVPAVTMHHYLVVRMDPAKGQTEPRAQIKEGTSTAKGAARPLSEFTLFSTLLKDAPVGSYVKCKPCPSPNPQPADLEPDGAAVLPQSASASGAGATGGQGSIFDNNPYNFAAWHGSAPWGVDEAGHPGATHEAWHGGRFSGVLVVEYTARTPVFVPEGSLNRDKESRETLAFWKCRDSDRDDRFGIPGSSLKGVIRTLFETWTNSRLGFVSKENYEAIPYRRRTAKAWVVLGPHPEGGLKLASCEVKFAKKAGMQWTRRDGRDLVAWTPDPSLVECRGDVIDPLDTGQWQAVRYRANLLWTPDHVHNDRGQKKYSHLALRVTATTAHLTASDLERFESGFKHAAYQRHPDMVERFSAARLGKNYYQNLENERTNRSSRFAEMKDLSPGAIVFGLAEAGRMLSIGRNVNYLWPSKQSPGQLIGPALWPREDGALHLEGADPAEATFGFAGKHTPHSHPFRSRVRFTTFWAPKGAKLMEAVELGPLTSPTGTKLRARPLYLPPNSNGGAQTYDEAKEMRGRKFYWHQRWTGGTVPAPHSRAGWREREIAYKAAEDAEKHRPSDPTWNPDEKGLPSIRPLDIDTVFSGEVHFENLTAEELGALIVSISPGAYFGGAAGYAIKVGKAKPMGLGSLEATRVNLKLRRGSGEAYRALDADVHEPADDVKATSVSKYKTWASAPGRGAGEPEFARDLARLLRLPDATTVKTYERDPGAYGWLPDFDNSKGEPRAADGRPRAMRRARQL